MQWMQPVPACSEGNKMMAARKGSGALLKKKRPSFLKRNKEGSKRTPKRQPSVAGSNTAAQAKLSRLGPLLALVLLLFLVVGAGLAYGSAMRPQAAPVVQQETGSGRDQSAEAFAVNLVGAWLSATSDDSRTLEMYMPEANESVEAENPVEYRDLTVVSAEETEQGPLSVIVSATVKTTEKVDDEEIEKWTPQYFQVAVTETDGRMAALNLPTPVQQPGPAEMPQLNYPAEVEDQEIQDTVQEFLSAYAAGDGDVTRFTSPDSDLTAIASPPFESVDVSGVFSAGEAPSENPENGEQTSVLANAAVQTSAGERTAQYALTLTSRDGRWEVKTIDPAPLTATE